MSKQNVLVVGSGGREHAILWKLAQSARVDKLFVAPGNGGTRLVAENVPIPVTDINGLVSFAKQNHIDLTIIGPDDPLAAGIVDAFHDANLRVFGPTKAAAQIEASKAFSKQLMAHKGIPTAQFGVFHNVADALNYLEDQKFPLVVKASGLALGKGVIICKSRNEAKEAVLSMMTEKVFGEAGNEIVIEEFLDGQEISIHAVSDGKNYVMFPTAQDHKPIFDNDKGPNTGGMGTFAPVPWVTRDQITAVEKQVVIPTLGSLSAKDSPFSGCLYPGLKMTADGAKVLEFNARFGDPEMQAYMRLLETDFLELVEATIDGTLNKLNVTWRPGFAVCVVVASGGYPGDYKKGVPIKGLEELENDPEIVVFHAGTSFDGHYKTSGGRVLGVTALGPTLQEALDKAYAATGKIHFDGMQYRSDIGKKAL